MSSTRGKGSVIRALTLPGNTNRLRRDSFIKKQTCFISRECCRRDREVRGTAVGRSASSAAERPRLACIRVVIVFIKQGAVAYARGSTSRGRGRRSSIVGLVYNERLRCVSCASGVLSKLKGRVVAGFVGRALVW